MRQSLQQHLPFDVDLSPDVLLKKYPIAFETLLQGQSHISPLSTKKSQQLLSLMASTPHPRRSRRKAEEFAKKKGPSSWYDFVSHTLADPSTANEQPYLQLFDRKLRVVCQHTRNTRQWLRWAYEALSTIHAREQKGDNLLLARLHLLVCFIVYYHDKFDEYPKSNSMNKVATLIAEHLRPSLTKRAQ